MPKIMPNSWIKANGGSDVWSYNDGTKKMTCRLCRFSVILVKLYPLERHMDRKNHRINLGRFYFIDDVTKLLSSCNIPLSVVNHPTFIAFMEKYCGQRPPSRPTINNHLKSQSSNILSQIKENVQGKDVYISLDETRDIKDRPMTAVLMGSLDGDNPTKPYLIDLLNVGSLNHLKVFNLVRKNVDHFLGPDYQASQLKLFISDGASYCVKAAGELKKSFPKVIHVTCLAHGFHRLAEFCRNENPEANLFVGEMKKLFLFSASRKRKFTDSLQVPLPPSPVITR
eukprot:TRINITY_DN287_c0_g1_i17.p1 TRINITY_DN287_c0_g1~~TRINITY_DN287_c0_g1_i17.p1  ORF type:complete len:283 (+),score=8.15 TRINITY_DN287_c0_g1_i17:39-887(+)